MYRYLNTSESNFADQCYLFIYLFILCRVNDDGFAPLDVAAMLGALPIVKMLLLYGAQEGSKCKCMVFWFSLEIWHPLLFATSLKVHYFRVDNSFPEKPVFIFHTE